MTDELKPCPFCGEKVAWREYSLFAKRIAIEKGLPLVPMIRCESCGAMVSFDPIEDPEPNYKKEAAGTLWNNRCERTCNAEQIPYTPGCYEGYRCSVCHCIEFESDKPNYCPNCGAKVIDNE